MNIAISLIALLGGVLYPLYAALFAKTTKRKLMENQEWLSQTYRTIMITQWALVAPLLVLIHFSEYEFGTLGLSFITNPLWVLGLIAAGFLGLAMLQQMKIPQKRLPSLKKQMQASMYILPKNKREYAWSIGLSFTAGICEEIIFRGLLLVELGHYLPLIPAILLVNVCFALGHIGTGLKNMSMTFILGIIWSTLYYFTGSLWVPILLHILVDIYSMTTAIKIFQGPDLTTEAQPATAIE